jgi:hypothetical protein
MSNNKFIKNLKNLLKLITNYENNINKSYVNNNKKLNRYKNMLTNIISEYHIACCAIKN